MDLQQVGSEEFCVVVPVGSAPCQCPAETLHLFYNSAVFFFQIINVDWVHVETRAGDITKSDKGVQLVLGQLIDK